MITFLVITGMILWCVATFGVVIAAIGVAVGNGGLTALVSVTVGAVLAAASVAGIIVTIDSNGWFKSPLPADGCYHLTRDNQLVPVYTGKTMTVIPVENANFVPIACPGGDR